jgi:hypothetical protein
MSQQQPLHTVIVANSNIKTATDIKGVNVSTDAL